ncbi:aldehyde dehydrogenase family protein [Leisingera sp. ANG-Vp]|uniref:aldehyde dehydrogenase family protein n=1 Tax=Leisingera sp. ANG-Vp TaxID=1577896 RepID=UPI00068C0592|nr:aldehyde dehydrogenase family protein [Leisingera sp. ANG-Vp]
MRQQPGGGTGLFKQPAVIANVSIDAKTACNEIFCPAVTISRFTEGGQALKIAYANCYGLASSVWTKDILTAMKMTSQLRYGMTWVTPLACPLLKCPGPR